MAELSVVIPAFNEEGAIREVLSEWIRELERLAIDYEMLVYNDGSSDRTGSLLQEIAQHNPRLQVASQPNRGHGPTLLRGYREARGDWLFQVDADGEMPTDGFETLWSRRQDYDFLFGCRVNRRSKWDRRLITTVSRWTVRLLFGGSCRDVNTPYRLMRRRSLQTLLPFLPEDTFAPNIILSGMVARSGLRLYEHSVPSQKRRAGKASLVRWSLWRAALRAFCQTIAAAGKGRRRR